MVAIKNRMGQVGRGARERRPEFRAHLGDEIRGFEAHFAIRVKNMQELIQIFDRGGFIQRDPDRLGVDRMEVDPMGFGDPHDVFAQLCSEVNP